MRIIPFAEEISRDSIEGLLSSLRANYSAGCVVVDSPGGEFEFFSRLAPPLARTGFVSVGKRVASAAIFLHLLGRRRLALPDATFFFHEVRTIIGPNNEVSVHDLESALEIEQEMRERWTGSEREFVRHWHSQLVAAQSWMLSFISKQTGLPSSRFIGLMRHNTTLSAREAMQYGVVHRIISTDELNALQYV